MKTLSLEFRTGSKTNPAVQSGVEITDLEIDGLHFQWIESKAQINCAVITQLICTFALHKAGFLMMWLMFLVVIL